MPRQSARPSGHRNVSPIRRIAGTVLLALAAIALLVGIYSTYHAMRFNRVARTATAAVLHSETSERPGISKTHSGRGRTVSGTVRELTLVVRFPTERGTVRTRIETTLSEYFGAVSASLIPSDAPFSDETVVVLYDPDRPERARLSEYRDVWGGLVISLIATFAFLVFGLIARQGIYLR